MSISPIPGMIVMTTHGSIRSETADSWGNMRDHVARLDWKDAVEWEFIGQALVDKARNEASHKLLKSKNQWLWFLDGDMQWTPDLFDRMLMCAYEERKDADIVGGYCNLRGEPYSPTIDRGSGLWESHDAFVGAVDVMRTGAACLLIKRHVLERMVAPWFEVRMAGRPVDYMAEVDNYARQKFDGDNPWQNDTKWQQLLQCAREDSVGKAAAPTAWERYANVGEDSGFCDKAKALGFTIVVQTNAVCKHIDTRAIGPEDHMKIVKRAREETFKLVGIGG